MYYTSYESRRVALSVLGAETYAFVDAFDFEYRAKTDLGKLLDRRVSLPIFTDSKSGFDFITKCSQTQERRLMIGVQAVGDAYAVQDIGKSVSFVVRTILLMVSQKSASIVLYATFYRLKSVILAWNNELFVASMELHQPNIRLLHLFAT